MCPTNETININDPELTEKPQDIKWLTKRHATRLSELGMESKAWRSQRCADVVAKECPNNHYEFETWYCELRSCTGCGPRRAARYFERWKDMLKVWAEGTHGVKGREFTRFTYCDIRIPLQVENLRTFSKTLRTYVEDKLAGQDAIIGINWSNVVGYENGCALARILFVYDRETHPDHDWWKGLWPDAEVDVHTIPIYRLPYFFERLFLVPYLPKSPEDRAQQEYIFNGIRMLHGSCPSTHNFEKWEFDNPEDHAEELIVLEPQTNTTNSPPDHAHGLIRGKHCRKCGQPFVRASRWLPVSELREVLRRRNPADFFPLRPPRE